MRVETLQSNVISHRTLLRSFRILLLNLALTVFYSLLFRGCWSNYGLQTTTTFVTIEELKAVQRKIFCGSCQKQHTHIKSVLYLVTTVSKVSGGYFQYVLHVCVFIVAFIEYYRKSSYNQQYCNICLIF